MKPKKRSGVRGTHIVKGDDEEYLVKGKEVVRKGRNKSVVKFKAKGKKGESPVKRINDKFVVKNDHVTTNKKKTTYRKVK